MLVFFTTALTLYLFHRAWSRPTTCWTSTKHHCWPQGPHSCWCIMCLICSCMHHAVGLCSETEENYRSVLTEFWDCIYLLHGAESFFFRAVHKAAERHCYWSWHKRGGGGWYRRCGWHCVSGLSLLTMWTVISCQVTVWVSEVIFINTQECGEEERSTLHALMV